MADTIVQQATVSSTHSAAVVVHTHVPVFIDDANHETDALLEQLLAHSMLTKAIEAARMTAEDCLVVRGGLGVTMVADADAEPVKADSWFTRFIRSFQPKPAFDLSAANDFSMRQVG